MSETVALPQVEQAPRLPRLGQPWTHTLEGSRLRWALAVGGGLLLAASALHASGSLTGQTASGPLTGIAWAVLVSVLPLIAVVDAAARIIPNRIVYPTGGLCALLVAADTVVGDLGLHALLRAVLVAVAVTGYSLVVLIAAPTGGYGWGDVRLATLAAFVLGTHSWWLPIVCLTILAPLLAVTWVLLVALRGRGLASGVPYGPFLAAAAAAGVFAQPQLLALVA